MILASRIKRLNQLGQPLAEYPTYVKESDLAIKYILKHFNIKIDQAQAEAQKLLNILSLHFCILAALMLEQYSTHLLQVPREMQGATSFQV